MGHGQILSPAGGRGEEWGSASCMAPGQNPAS